MVSGLKTVFLGDASVGKTAISLRLTKDCFSEFIGQTIGAAYMFYKTDNRNFEIWDTAGQERFASISRLYYRDAYIAILVFDLSDLSTFSRLSNYIVEIKDVNRNCKIMVVGNKLDLVKDIDYVRRKLEKFKTKYDLYDYLTEDELNFILTSARNNIGIHDIVDRMISYHDTCNGTYVDTLDDDYYITPSKEKNKLCCQ